MQKVSHLLVFSTLILFLFGNCRKEEQLMKVSYAVHETSAATPNYSITYISDKSGTSTTASSNAELWDSSVLELHDKQFVSLTVECTAPQFDFIISIYVNGGLWQTTEMHNPNSSAMISGNP